MENDQYKGVEGTAVGMKKMLTGGNVLTFQVPSLSALNRVLRQEIMIKPCRCVTFSCDQTIDLSVNLLESDPSGTPLDIYKQKFFLSDQKFLDVSSSCTYLTNVMPTMEVAAAESLTIESGQMIDVSKAFVFHGFATLISDAINLRLDITANSGTLTGRTTFSASSLDDLFREFFSSGTKYYAPSDLRSPMIDNVFFTFRNPLFNVSGAAERATA
jgi:hypothetical protein